MPLDLTKIARQVEDMVARLKAGSQERRQHLQYALNILGNKTIDPEGLKKKIALSKTSWLVAGLVYDLKSRYKAPPPPPDFTAMATDGSHIDVDRHRSTRCYLINIGSIILNYGANPGASLSSHPRLYSADEELVITAAEPGGRQQMVEGALLGIKRGVEECRQLARMAAELPPGSSALALLDGSLILWGLVSMDYPEFVVEAMLDKGFLQSLEEMRRLSKDNSLAVASYISFSHSTDVVNALRVALCPHQPVNCDQHCDKIAIGKRECDTVAGINDRELFSEFLGRGERSALFISQSKIQKRYGDHRVHFFYLKVDDEIARVEIPQWVATDEGRLKLTHALILDQCQRGHGYPVALSEAHQQAVITGADRENFRQLVEMSMAEEKLPTLASAKSQSKRTRWV